MEGRVEKASVSRAAGAGDGRRGAPHAGQARAPAGRRSVHARQDGARGGGGKEVVVNEVMAGSSSSESRIITSAAAASCYQKVAGPAGPAAQEPEARAGHCCTALHAGRLLGAIGDHLSGERHR